MSAFEGQLQDDAFVVKCPARLDVKQSQDLLEFIKTLNDTKSKLVVFDFQGTTELNMAAYRPFVLLHQNLKKIDVLFSAVAMNPALLQQVHAAGLDSVFSPHATLNDAFKFAGLKCPEPCNKKPMLDVNFVNPFIKATLNALEVQANTPVKAGKIHLKQEGESSSIDIAGVLSMTSKAFQGSIALCFPASVFLAIYSNMVGEKHSEITKETEDAAGELLNMIFGQAKVELNSREDYQIQKAIPAVVRGKELSVRHLTKTIALILPFETEFGNFHLEVSLDK